MAVKDRNLLSCNVLVLLIINEAVKAFIYINRFLEILRGEVLTKLLLLKPIIYSSFPTSSLIIRRQYFIIDIIEKPYSRYKQSGSVEHLDYYKQLRSRKHIAINWKKSYLEKFTSLLKNSTDSQNMNKPENINNYFLQFSGTKYNFIEIIKKMPFSFKRFDVDGVVDHLLHLAKFISDLLS